MRNANSESRKVVAAERAVIGAILLNQDTFHEIVLSTNHFSDARWRKAYEAICEAVFENEQVNSATVAQASGVPARDVHDCTKFCKDPERIGDYAQVVKDAALDRNIRRLAQMATGSEKRGSELLAWLQSSVTKLAMADTGKDATHVGDVAERVVEVAYKRSRGLEVKCGEIELGLPPIDELLALNYGNVATVAGRPGMGKSAFVLWVILLLLLKGEKILLFSTEATEDEVTQRLLALITNISAWAIARKGMTWAKVDQLKEARDWLRQQPLWIDDQSHRLPDVLRQTRRYKAREGVTTVVIDHLQELKVGDRRARDERGEINTILSGIREVTREDPKICTWLVSQLNRGVESREDKRPMMSDLKESGKIEEASHMIFLLYRAAYYYKSARDDKPWKLDAMIAKNRNGPTGRIVLHWENIGQVGGVYDEVMHLYKMDLEAGGIVQEQGQAPDPEPPAPRQPPQQQGLVP